MQQLCEAIREECSPVVWRRAEQLARTATINGKRTHNDELELRIITKGGMVSPLVVLSPKHQDWSCECDSDDDACIHVAAGALWISRAFERGDDIPTFETPTAKVAYRLQRDAGHLRLERFLRRGEQLLPLEVRLTQHRAKDDVAIAPADLNVDVALGAMISGKVPRPLMERVLTALAECTDVTLDGEPIELGAARPVMCVQVSDQEGGFLVQAVQDPNIREVFDNGAVVQGRTLRPVGDLDLSPRDVEELRKGRLYPFGQVADLVGRVIPALEDRLPVNVDSEVLPNATPMQPRLMLQADYDGDALGVLPTIVYGDPPCARVDAGKLHYLGGPLPVRNERKEAHLLSELEGQLQLRIGHAQRYTGLSAVEMAERLRAFAQPRETAKIYGDGLEACFVTAELQPDLQFGDRFDLGFSSSDGDTVRHANPEAVMRAWSRGESLVPLMEGGWAPLPASFLAQHGHLIADLVAAKAERGELPTSSLPDIARLCEALDEPPPPAFGRLRALAEDFEGIPECELPADLDAELRHYQHDGVRWLTFLSQTNMGAMLADDMGLGKTIQALCVVQTPTLVVCPASVLHNWQKEIERFRPALSVHRYHGPGRSLRDDVDITLTTYAILRIDGELLAERRWDTVILDEAQFIKNSDSQVARAAYELDARFRITLTGTPVENRLEELWSQFHFLNRGLLGGRRDFQDRYARPISDGDERALAHLRARLRPFLLRRLKSEVAKELPPRTDVVLRCALGERENDLYEAIRAATHKEVVAQLAAGGSVLAALEALLRLRQAACHSALLPGQQGRADSSAKLELLMATLDEALAEGHRALIFSQWTSLLDLVEPHLEQAGVEFCRIDGSTRDRGAVVERFQSVDGPPVMLISLKAGGTGLNLTAADHVFLLDPWWNPAVEDQAADRAHRIGQDRPVLVHRLVAEGTVEERMLELQERKRALADAATGDTAAAGALTRDDLLALLSS